MKLKHLLLTGLCTFIIFNANGQIQCDNDSTGLPPLVDLQEDYFLGLYQGGLYPGGSNYIPAAHRNAGNMISKMIKPLDTLGNVDWADGRVVLAAFGASTAGEPFNHFEDLVHEADYLNPCLKTVGATNGGKGLDIMRDTIMNAFYWDDIENKMAQDGVHFNEVQVAWFKSGSKLDTIVEMPTMANGIADRYTECLNVIVKKFPNIKLIFVSGFVYGGYGDPLKEFYDVISEPGGLYNNFSAKWVVQRQIEGDTLLKFTGPDRRSPWIGYGPNVWADGSNPNEWDGLFWDCETEFSVDGGGYHMTNAGRGHEGQLIFDFFKNNSLTKRWFLDSPKWNSCDPFGKTSDGKDVSGPEEEIFTEQDIDLYPSPNDGNFYVRFKKQFIGFADVEIMNNLGVLVYANTMDTFIPNQGISINIQGLASGIYFLTINLNGEMITKEFIVQ